LVKRPEFKNMDVQAEDAIIIGYVEVLPHMSIPRNADFPEKRR